MFFLYILFVHYYAERIVNEIFRTKRLRAGKDDSQFNLLGQGEKRRDKCRISICGDR